MDLVAPAPEHSSTSTNGSAPIVSMSHVDFHYAGHHALRDVSLEVARGEVVGLLGHNGAGKTTTIRLLNGLLRPSSGSIAVLGVEPIAGDSWLRSQTSVVTDTLGLPDRQTARQALDFHARLWELDATEASAFGEDLLGRFGLSAVIDTPVKAYSRGMRQRLALARSMLHRPKLLLLDEPTLGMDPVGRKEFRDILAGLSDEGASVLMSTHDLGEVERACHRVVILHRGQVILDGSPEECVRPLMRNVEVDIELGSPLSTDVFEALLHTESIEDIRASGTRVTFVAEERLAIASAVRVLVNGGAEVVSVRSSAPTLEDVYLSMHSEGAS